jgi:uncharacterized protein (UPF0335 family)
VTYPDNTNSVAQDMLQSYFRRWRALEEQRGSVVEDLRQLFIETKSSGFDGKALRLAFRRVLDSEDSKKADALAERDQTVDLYIAAIVGTPLATGAGRARPAASPSLGVFSSAALPEPDRRLGDKDGQPIRQGGAA